MIELTIPMNTSRESKNRFLVERLLPALAASGSRYFVMRRVLRIPVFVVYLDAPATELERFESDLAGLLADFVGSLDAAALEPAANYDDLWGDVRKIHRLDDAQDTIDLRVSGRAVTHITRSGHYYRPEDPQLYNYFSFRAQPLVEQTLAFLEDDRRRREVMFVYALFAATSSLFDGGRGYLSFKSHVLGFFAHPHPTLPAYLAAFRSDYERAGAGLRALRVQAETIAVSGDGPSPDGGGDELAGLIAGWSGLLRDMYDGLYAVRDTRQRSMWRSAKAQLDYLQFRRLSEFHRQAFSRRGQRTISSREFGAYRMCVNFVYLLLPTLGISSRKRVEAAYLLVRSIEDPVDFLAGVRAA